MFPEILELGRVSPKICILVILKIEGLLVLDKTFSSSNYQIV